MSDTINYKGYIGSVEFSDEDGLFYGRVLGVRSLISYEGKNINDLVADFHSAVDEFLEANPKENQDSQTAIR